MAAVISQKTWNFTKVDNVLDKDRVHYVIKNSKMHTFYIKVLI